MNSLIKRNAIDQIFDDFFGSGMDNIFSLTRPRDATVKTYLWPRQKMTDDGLSVSWDLPGVKKEDLKVDVEDGLLKISAKRYDSEEQIYQTYSLSDRYDHTSADAQLTDGVLTISLKEREDKKPKRLTVSIK